MPRPLSCWTAAGSRLGKRGWLSVTPMRRCSSRSSSMSTVKVGDCPKVCCTALVASSETMSRTVSAASVSAGQAPLGQGARAHRSGPRTTEAGSLGRVTDASRWSAMATSSLSHGTGVRHGGGWFEYGPGLVLRARVPLPGRSRVAIHQDMHISVARSGELCDGRPYLGGPVWSKESAMQHGPAVRRRKLGAELRALRTGAGLTSGEAARLVGWHQSKVSRIETGAQRGETGRRAVTPGRLRGAATPTARAAPGAGGLRRGRRPAATGGTRTAGCCRPTYRDFISLESQAGAMRTLETSVVPGLLQTPEYARAVTRAAVDGLRTTRLDALVEVRLARQDVLRGASAAGAERRPGRGGAAAGGRRPGGDGAAAGTAGRGGPAAPSAAPGAAVHRRGAYRRHRAFRNLLIFAHILIWMWLFSTT